VPKKLAGFGGQPGILTTGLLSNTAAVPLAPVGFGDEGHKKGWCLYKMGCKGPETYNNCPSLEYNNVGGGVWPIGVGHPCFGCSEEGVGFTKPLFSLAEVKTHTPPNAFPSIDDRQSSSGISSTASGIAGLAVGAAVGASIMTANKLDKNEKSSSDEPEA